jgi:hypothetical protein
VAVVNVEDEIRDIVRDINEAWLERRPGELARFLDEEIVIAPPGFQGLVQGRQAAVDSYEQFVAAARVHAADFDEPDVQAWGDTAVATCRFTLDYAMGGARGHSGGLGTEMVAQQPLRCRRGAPGAGVRAVAGGARLRSPLGIMWSRGVVAQRG